MGGSRGAYVAQGASTAPRRSAHRVSTAGTPTHLGVPAAGTARWSQQDRRKYFSPDPEHSRHIAQAHTTRNALRAQGAPLPSPSFSPFPTPPRARKGADHTTTTQHGATPLHSSAAPLPRTSAEIHQRSAKTCAAVPSLGWTRGRRATVRGRCAPRQDVQPESNAAYRQSLAGAAA